MGTNQDELVPKDWTASEPSDDFSYFTNGNTTVILKTHNSFVLRSSDRFQTKSLCVYAETIQLDGDIELPEKDLLLVCNKLLLPPGKKFASISVSGKPGNSATPNTPLDDRNNGGNGGSIVLCVEDFDSDHTPGLDADGNKIGLYMQAYGGAGGRGALNLGDGVDSGGPGGKGGNGGNINVYVGQALNAMVNDFLSLASEPQMPWLAKLNKLRIFDCKGHVSLKTKDRLVEVTKQSIDAMNPLDDIRQLLGLVDLSNPPAGFDPSDSILILGDLVSKLQRTPTEPCVTESTQEAILKFHDVLDGMRQADPPYTPEVWKGLQDTTPVILLELEKALSTPAKDSVSVVQMAVSDVAKELRAKVSYVTKRMTTFYPCLKGNGGRGGTGALPGSKAGADGAPGDLSSKAKVETLNFSGSPRSLSIPYALAHPDQCQMLLNQADLVYFAASGGEVVQNITKKQLDDRQAALDGGKSLPVVGPENEPPPMSPFEDARHLYQRVLSRLHFVPALKKQLSGTSGDLTNLPAEERQEYGLALAYAAMAINRLSLDPIAQLVQLYDHASQNSERASMGKDFMGHDGLWAPRLTYRFYQKQLESLGEEFVHLAKSFGDIQGKEKAQAGIERTQQNMQLQIQGLETRIRLLTAPSSGKLAMLGTQIAEFTPILKAKRNLIQNLIIDAKIKIALKKNLDAKICLDAVAMIAFCPDPLNFAAQTAGGIYKCGTTVQGLDGQGVDKRYVISQFGDAGSTLESLTAGYTARPDGAGVEVDDPGATKLLSTKADLVRLLKNFREVFPELHALIETQLNAYVGMVEKRNSAVMEYNASVQLLAKALSDKEFYEKKGEGFGQAILSFDPASPSVRLWLVKFRQDLRHTLLATMYSAERALQFWGLVKRFAPIPAAEDFSDIDLLKTRRLHFDSVFADTLTTWAGNGGTIWPELSAGSLSKGKGKFFHLSAEDVKRFRETPSQESVIGADPPRTNMVYEAYFTIKAVRKAESKVFADLAGHADVRIDSVRAWLYGATVGRRDNKAELTVNLVHLGNDTIVAPNNDVFEFNHDAVMLRYTYDPTNVKKAEDIPLSVGFDTMRWPSFRELALLAKDDTNGNVVASIGPFATWRLTVSSEENLDLDMSRLTDIAIEFTGASRGFGQTQ